MYGWDILCGISNGTFEIPHKIFYPYIKKYYLNTLLTIYELSDLRAHTYFWNAPLGSPGQMTVVTNWIGNWHMAYYEHRFM